MIKIQCPHCSQHYEVSSDDFGATAACQACGKDFVIAQPSTDTQVPPENEQAQASKPCPYCGEQILFVAKKCKHCGEFLDDKANRVTTGGLASQFRGHGKDGGFAFLRWCSSLRTCRKKPLLVSLIVLVVIASIAIPLLPKGSSSQQYPDPYLVRLFNKKQHLLTAKGHAGDKARAEFEKNLEKEKARAQKGNAEAQYGCGVILLAFDKHSAEGIQWMKKAAEQGHARAQNELGLCYRDGDGVKQSTVEALGWLRKAAEQGNKIAQQNYDELIAAATNRGGSQQNRGASGSQQDSGNAMAELFMNVLKEEMENSLRESIREGIRGGGRSEWDNWK